jgi:branched-subunit amino acid ABC-type transport system permease component
MKKELIKILPDLKQSIEQGIAYGGDIFNRAVVYYSVVSLINIAVGVILLIGSSYGIYKATKWFKQDDRDDTRDPFWIFIILPIIFGIILFIEGLSSYIKLQYLPEVYLLQLFT